MSAGWCVCYIFSWNTEATNTDVSGIRLTFCVDELSARFSGHVIAHQILFSPVYQTAVRVVGGPVHSLMRGRAYDRHRIAGVPEVSPRSVYGASGCSQVNDDGGNISDAIESGCRRSKAGAVAKNGIASDGNHR